MSFALPAARLLAVAGFICLSLAGCGRRGALEPPPETAAVAPTATRVERRAVSSDPTVARIEDDDAGEEEAAEAIVPSPTPTPRKRSRAYTVPKEPFVLDPLL